MLPDDVLGYIIGLCPAIVACRLTSCCKFFRDSFVWNHITHGDDARTTFQQQLDLYKQLHQHREELVRFDTLVHSTVGILGERDSAQLVAALAPRAKHYQQDHTPFRAVHPAPAQLNHRILESLDLSGCPIESTIQVLSTALPNLHGLCVSKPTGAKRKEECRTLFDNITRNTGALTSLTVSIKEPGRMSRGLFGHLKAAAAANPHLRRLALQFVLVPFGVGDQAYLDHFLTKLRSRGESVSPEQLHASWSSLPEQIRSALGISISQLSFAGRTMFQHFMLRQTSGSAEISLDTAATLWNAVYPNPSLDAACAFSIFVRSQSQPQNTNLAQWIVLKALEVFRAIDLHVAPLDRCADSIFGVINIALISGIDTKGGVECAYELASLHHPTSPFSCLARAYAERVLTFVAEERTTSDGVLGAMFEYAKVQQKPIELFEDRSYNNSLAWLLFMHAPEIFASILQSEHLFDPNELVSSSRTPGLLDLMYRFLRVVRWHIFLDTREKETMKAVKVVLSQIRRLFPSHKGPKAVLIHLFRWWLNEMDGTPEWLSDLLTMRDLLDKDIVNYLMQFDDPKRVIFEIWNSRDPDETTTLDDLLAVGAQK
eukprot:TRINITY_DN5629_c0_g1_i1.p1 TRINITY_DN5629_c0_g1~~TRINITY_DN5629_c0_g1_i1.p1  ORF type:complete len:600 (-),score=76.03 TRINITY_DN5629_c0_g1_i1:53-1852(-)